MEPTNKICSNCESPFDKEYEFCPHCGQKAKDELTIGVLFYNTISNYFSFDARFFRSFIPLMFKPGFVAKQFVKGKRLQYLHPAQYYLFVSVVFFFILSFQVRKYNNDADKLLHKGFETEKKSELININPLDSADVANLTKPIFDSPEKFTGLNEVERKIIDSTLKANLAKPNTVNFNWRSYTKKLDSLIAAGASEEEQLKVVGFKDDSGFMQKALIKQGLKLYKQEGAGIVQVFFDVIPIALFFLLPIFAFILKLFYWKRGSFPYHLVFSFYYFSYLFIILGLLIGLSYFIDIPGWIELIVILSTFVYLWLSAKHFYEQGYFVTLLKTGFATFIYFPLIIIATCLIIAASFFLY